MKRKLYFGHPINVYGTELQERLLVAIGDWFTDWEIENPNQPHHQEGYQRYAQTHGRGMAYYFQEVLPACEGGIFLPFRDGTWGMGVAGEAAYLVDCGKQIWSISYEGFIWTVERPEQIRRLTVEQTRERIRMPDGSTRPY